MGSLIALSLPFSEANRSAVWLSVLLPRRAAHPDNNSCRFNATIRTFLTGPFSLRPFPGIRTVSTVLATIQLRLVANIQTNDHETDSRNDLDCNGRYHAR